MKNNKFWFFILKALKRKRNRTTLYFFIFLILLGGLFEPTGNIMTGSFLSDSFGATGLGGLFLSLGIQVRSELPSPPFENPDYITYHMISLIWIIGGIAVFFAYIKHLFFSEYPVACYEGSEH